MSDPNQPPGPPFNAPQPPPPPPPSGQPMNYATPGGYGYPGPYNGPAPDSDARTMALLAHVLGIFTGFLGPLIIWLIKKDQQPFVDDQGKEALNFKLLMLIIYVGLIVVSCVTLGIGSLLFLPVWVVEVIFGVLAAVEANKGNAYRYPLNIRFIK